ncbi:transcription antitermination protein nusG [Candidatus Thermokryptus mobilis]|uniref:Transcription termination/antitermination protein NusG n=2 Tax=Candidatus Thermokryptus mobilis TaxID=1643428 RepID=A0A0S4N2W4_9BACT|nr:transcription termination/antitermination protein NusG [Candidatus Thermokryptus mobilis]CUU04269.1 transcription antitermination protein nusG [Candidatus Thermokryptus mobilis]
MFDMARRWYAVRTYSGHENRVKKYIENELAEGKFKDKIFSVFVPTEKVTVVKEGKKKSRIKAFFPGYILIEAEMDDEVKNFIKSIPSVVSFVGPKGNPVPLREDEVERFVGRVEEGERVDVPFRVGDSVRVIEGPFTDFQGVIQEVNSEKMKLKVMINIFGRKTPVELDFTQVEVER